LRVQSKIREALSEHRAHRTSMLQDLTAGRATEIDSINSAVIRAGQMTGVATPINATLADLVHMMEAR
jgi:2-dehydropantoate 2-reductase